MLRDTLLTQSLVSFSSQTYGIAVGVVLLLLAARVQGGTLPVGDLALVVTYAGTVATVGSYLGGDLAGWRQYGVSLRRLRELLPGMPAVALAEPRPVLRGPLAPRPAPTTMPSAFRSLQVRDLRCSPGGSHAISGIDLDLGPGELVVVTGRVGAGKTTLLRALLGMLPSDGVVRWNGKPVDEPATFLVPPRCAYLGQAPVLFSGTLRENLTLGRPVADERLLAAIRSAALETDLAGFPTGLETPVGRRGLRLSGGQAQRVALARLLVLEPQVACLDDLSSALDPATEAAILGHLRDRRDLACLAVSHRRGVLAAADRIVVLRDGRVEAVGSLEQLLQGSAELRAIWHGEDDLEPEEPRFE
jgi:ABC-type multidrug transport system fused ATPase/permease subunit